MALILIVDDLAVNREYLVTLLRYKNHATLEAADGAEAMGIVKAKHPDLVICDVLMPAADGFEFVRRLRHDPSVASVPVIFYSAHYQGREAVELARACGVEFVLTKPCPPEEVLRAVDEALSATVRPVVRPLTETFDREHLQLVTDMLSKKAEELTFTNQQLSALVELDLKLGSERDPHKLLDEVCRGARQLVGAAFGTLVVEDKNDKSQIYVTTSGLERAGIRAPNRAALNQWGLEAIARDGGARRGHNPDGDPTGIGLPQGVPPVTTYIACPITSLSRNWGWLYLANKTDADGFSDEEERLMAILAAQAGRVYENGSLYVRLNRHAEQLRQEIAARKRVEEEVRETRNFLASIFDNIPNMIFVKDAEELRFVRLNPAGEKLTGYSEKELLGRNDYDLFPKEQADFFVAKDRETLASGERLFVVEETITAKDGTRKILQTKKLPLLGKDGSPRYLLGFSEDITERKGAEVRLRESEERFRQVAENIREVFWLTDPAKNQILYVSPGYEEIWGRSCASVYASPRDWVDAIHADDRDRVLEAAKTRQASGGYAEEYRIVRPDGTIRWILDKAFPVFDRDGTAFRIAGIAEDITERKRAADELRESERRFSDMLGTVQLVSLMLDREARITYCNDYLLMLTGWRREEVIGRSWFELFVPPDLRDLKLVFAALLANSPDTWHHQNEILTRSGGRRLIQWNNTLLRSASGEAIGTASIGEDVTERKQHEQRIARLSRIQAVLSGINSAIVRIRDRQDLFKEACRIAVDHGRFSIAWIAKLDHATGTLLPIAQAGLSMDLGAGGDASNRPVGLVPGGTAEAALRDKRPAFDNDIERGLAEMQNNAGADTLSVRRAAIRLGAKSVIVLPLYVEGQPFGILTLYASERDFFDAEELKLLTELAGDISFSLDFIAKEEKVDYLAYYDTLTELPNRSLFFDRLTHQLGTAAREHVNVALVLMDLDRFRLINDTLGRHAGDALIKAVAKRIKETFRDQDILARVGADSFAVTVSATWNATDAARVLEVHNRKLFGEPFLLGKEELRISAPFGVAVFPGDGDSAETLYANAEAALKKAKSSGEHLLFYSPDMNARIADSLRLENRLRQALENGQMVLWYQPKVKVSSREIIGFEALMRWQDPETGMVPPAKFIPLMEQTGLILEAGRWALSQVARDCALWKASGINPPRVAVNVSPIQLRQKDFVATVVEAAEKTEAAGSMLDLEITESVIMENVEAIIPILQTVRGLGVEIAVDDFGTGYSSLAYIARLPIHDLKIDRSFVVGMTHNEDSLTIVKSVISLAHSLRLNVVAEGVETEEQAVLLLELGCDEMQGYLFSPAVPPDEVPVLLSRQRAAAIRPARRR